MAQHLFSESCKWIWTDATESDYNQYAQFVDFFYAAENDAAQLCYEIHISADSQYAIWLNGCFAGFGQYADYPEYKIYDTIDITPYVREGKNKLCILGYYQGRPCSVYYGHGKPGVLFDIVQTSPDGGQEVVLESTEKTLCRPCADYKSGEIEVTTGQLGYVFEYNAQMDDGWRDEIYFPGNKQDSVLWKKASAANCTQRLLPRPIEKLVLKDRPAVRITAQGVFRKSNASAEATTAAKMQSAYLSHRRLSELTKEAGPLYITGERGIPFTADNCGTEDDGIYLILDLGREESGYFDLALEAAAGTEIWIGYGEHLEDLRIRTHIGGRNFSGKYTCSGRGCERFTHYIKRMGCRYMQLFIGASHFTLHYAGLLPAAYPLQLRGQFSCCDSLHNQIYQTCLRTLQLCMHEHYEDCPWREQALYAMDSRNQMLCGYYAFGEYRFAKESLRLLALGQLEDGLLALCAPAVVSVNIPSFSLMWITELYEYVLYSGDFAFAAEMMPYAEKIIRSFWKKARGGELLGPWNGQGYWNFYEWSPMLDGGTFRTQTDGVHYDAPLNAFYMIALHAMSRLCRLLEVHTVSEQDYSQQAAWYELLAEGVLHAFDQTFWDDGAGAYCSYIVNSEKIHFSELTNALALYAGLVPAEKQQRIADLLTGAQQIDFNLFESANPAVPAWPREWISITLSHSIFKYEALLSCSDKFGSYVLNDIAEKWGYMLYHNATSFWETLKGDADFDQAGSLCHGWSAIPVIIYYKYILGVSPKTAGFTDYTFLPKTTPIISAEGVVPKPDGHSYTVKILPSGFEFHTR